MDIKLGIVCLVALLMQISVRKCNAQVSNGVNLSNRRILPPRVLQPNSQNQPRPTLPRQRPPFNRFAPNPGYGYGSGYLSNRVSRIEENIRHISGVLNGFRNTVQMTVDSVLTERFARIQEQIEEQKVRIDDNQNNVDSTSQQLKYIKNSNANMQKRMDRIEAVQREQAGSIDHLERTIESMGQNQGGNQSVSNPTLRSAVDTARLDELTSSLGNLRERINSTDNSLVEQDARMRAITSNVFLLSDKTNALERDTVSTARWLSSIRGDVNAISRQLFDLQIRNHTASSNAYDVTKVERLQASVFGLNATVTSLRAIQQKQGTTLKVNGLFGKYVYNNNPFSLLHETAETHAIRQENQAVSSAEARMRFQRINEEISSAEQLASNQESRLQSLENNSLQTPDIGERIRAINLTLLRHREDLRRFGRIRNGSQVLNDEVQRTGNSNSNLDNANDFEAILAENASSSQQSLVTREMLEERLEKLVEGLMEIWRDAEAYGAGNVEGLRSNEEALDAASTTKLQTSVDILNTTAAIHGTMLQQAIQAMGDYDHRLRHTEEKGRSNEEEFRALHQLLQNATESLSKMSLSVAEHDLILPSLFDSLRSGDDILLDMTQQLYDHSVSIENLNQTLTSAVRPRESNAEHLELRSPSSGGVYQVNSAERTLSAEYVRQLEFSELALSVAEILGRIDSLNQRQVDAESILNSVVINVTSCGHCKTDEEEQKKKIWNEINSTKSVMELLENVVASLSGADLEMSQSIREMKKSIALLQSNKSTSIGSGLYSEEFIHLLDTSVRQLRMEVTEQRKWLANQRRRIRHLEDERFETYARASDVDSLNATTVTQLEDIRRRLREFTVDAATNQVHRSILQANESTNRFQTEEDSLSLAVLQRKVDHIMSRLNEEGLDTFKNSTRNNDQSQFMARLRTVPITLRILEGQVQEFQSALHNLAQLEVKLGALSSMRNLVFQNSGDITTFHQSVTALEGEIEKVKRKSSVIEFSNQRLNSYQDDLRSKVNQTQMTLDRANAENAIQGQQIRLLSRFLQGNASELTGRIEQNRMSVDERREQLSTVSNQVAQLERDIRRQSSADLIRHTDLDSRLERDEKRIQSLAETASSNSDALVTLTRSVAEEANTRSTIVEGHNADIESLRTTLLTLERQETSSRQLLNQNNQQLIEVVGNQARHSNEILRLQTSHRSAYDEIQNANRDVLTVQEKQTALANKLNAAKSEFSELRETIGAQITSQLSMKQSLIVINDDINSLQQDTQSTSALCRRNELILERHADDISFILEHSSNHTVALERLRQAVRSEPKVVSHNTTNELITEVALLSRTLHDLSEQFASYKRKTGISEASAVRLEANLLETATTAEEYERRVRSNQENLERLRSDIRRYGDRIRTIESSLHEHSIARDDLQQVVLSNSNRLSSFRDLRNELERLEAELFNFNTRQENRSQFFERSLNEAKRSLVTVTNQVSEHDNTLQILRQDRISFEANLDQILRSSSNLEQLLRATVTDLAQLRRDFESSADVRSAVPRIQRVAQSLEVESQRVKQTVTANEHKISRVQDLVDRTLTSVSNLLATAQNRIKEDQSREHSRTNDVRALREGLGRSSVLLRTLQNELHQHNNRIQMLNQRVIDVDSRVSNTLSDFSFPPNTNQHAVGDEENFASGREHSITTLTESGQEEGLREDRVYNGLTRRLNHLSTTVSNSLPSFEKKLNELEEKLVKFTLKNQHNVTNCSLQNQTVTPSTNRIHGIGNNTEKLNKMLRLVENLVDQENLVEIAQATNSNIAMQRLIRNVTEAPGNAETAVQSKSVKALSSLVLKLAHQFDAMSKSEQRKEEEKEQEEEEETSYQLLPSYELKYEENAGEATENNTFSYDVDDYALTYSQSPATSEDKGGVRNGSVITTKRRLQNVSKILRDIASTLLASKSAEVDVATEKNQTAFPPIILNETLKNISLRLTLLEDRLQSNDSFIDENLIDARATKQPHPTYTSTIANREDQSTTEEVNEQSEVLQQLMESTSMGWKAIGEIRQNISLLSSAFSDSNLSRQLQDLNIRSLQMMQENHSRKFVILQNSSRELSASVTSMQERIHEKLENSEQRIEDRFDDVRQHFTAQNDLMSNRVLELEADVLSINSSATLASSAVATIQPHLTSILTERITPLQASLGRISRLMVNILSKSRDQTEKVEKIDSALNRNKEQVRDVIDDVNKLNLTIEWMSSKTEVLAAEENRKRSMDKYQINQTLLRFHEALERTKQNLTTFSQVQEHFEDVAEEISESLANQTKISNLDSKIALLFKSQDDLGLSLVRHSMELRGISRTIQTFENLIETIRGTLTLHGNKLAVLRGGNVSSENTSSENDLNILTEIALNHTSQLEEIERQIVDLFTKVKQQTSVRIVVPPSNQDNRVQVTTAPTTTSSAFLYVPPPTSVSVTSVTPNELILSWVPPVGINNYRVTVENTEDSRDVFQISAIGPPVMVGGLAPLRRYLISVQSVNNLDLSAPSSVYAETGPPATSRPTSTSTTTTTTTTTSTAQSLSQPSTPDPNSIYSDSVANTVEDTASPSAIFSCNFDQAGICNFTNDLTDDFDWSWWNGSTPSSDTGPSSDHTQRQDMGHYMFIEASRPRQVGHVARLSSPLLRATSGQCLRFHHHMYGAGTGDLNVLITSADGVSSRRIWHEAGDRGNQWKNAKVTLASDSPFKLSFEAIRGSDYHGDTAIDDVTIHEGACPAPLLQCSFENADTCDFIQDYDDDFDWEVNTGSTSSADTGPIADHTHGTAAGYYLFLEASNPRQVNDKTRLSSPILHPTSGQCLQFYFHMHGSDIGALHVYLRHHSNSRDLGLPIWSRNGPQGNSWQLGRVTLSSLDSFQIVLEGVRGDNYHGDIAIDDISVTDGSCNYPVCSIGEKFADLCYEVENDATTYQAAVDVCVSKGGLLAAVKTPAQHSFVSDLLNSDTNVWRMFWIGLDDRDVEGRFIFSDGVPLGGGYDAWSSSEPSDSLGDEDCVILDFASNSRQWNDSPCNLELPFVCQYPVVV